MSENLPVVPHFVNLVMVPMISSKIDAIYFPVVAGPSCAAEMADGRAVSGRPEIWPLELPEKFHVIRITATATISCRYSY